MTVTRSQLLKSAPESLDAYVRKNFAEGRGYLNNRVAEDLCKLQGISQRSQLLLKKLKSEKGSEKKLRDALVKQIQSPYCQEHAKSWTLKKQRSEALPVGVLDALRSFLPYKDMVSLGMTCTTAADNFVKTQTVKEINETPYDKEILKDPTIVHFFDPASDETTNPCFTKDFDQLTAKEVAFIDKSIRNILQTHFEGVSTEGANAHGLVPYTKFSTNDVIELSSVAFKKYPDVYVALFSGSLLQEEIPQGVFRNQILTEGFKTLGCFGQLDDVKRLVERIPRIEDRVTCWKSAFSGACEKNHVETARACLDYFDDLKKGNEEHSPPDFFFNSILCSTFMHGSAETARLLVSSPRIKQLGAETLVYYLRYMMEHADSFTKRHATIFNDIYDSNLIKALDPSSIALILRSAIKSSKKAIFNKVLKSSHFKKIPTVSLGNVFEYASKHQDPLFLQNLAKCSRAEKIPSSSIFEALVHTFKSANVKNTEILFKTRLIDRIEDHELSQSFADTKYSLKIFKLFLNDVSYDRIHLEAIEEVFSSYARCGNHQLMKELLDSRRAHEINLETLEAWLIEASKGQYIHYRKTVIVIATSPIAFLIRAKALNNAIRKIQTRQYHHCETASLEALEKLKQLLAAKAS